MTGTNGVAVVRAGRGLMPGTTAPVSIAELLPGIFQDDDFAVRWCQGLDDVLAPVFATLDCLDAYLDPELTPADFLEWLGQWVGMVVDDDWPLGRRRAAVGSAIEIFRLRGTVIGLIRHIEVLTGGRVTVADNGGVATSSTPGGALPGESVPRLAVRVTVDDPATVDEAALDRVVASAKPAHVVHRVEVLTP